MKKIKGFISGLSAVVLLNSFSCDRHSYEKIGVLDKGETVIEVVGENYFSSDILYKFPKGSLLYEEFGETLKGSEIHNYRLWNRLPYGTEVYVNKGVDFDTTSLERVLWGALEFGGVCYLIVRAKNIRNEKRFLRWLEAKHRER